VEIDDYCTRVLEKHWPGVPKYRDIKDCGGAPVTTEGVKWGEYHQPPQRRKHELAPVDLIAGGFPCQPHSVAGKRRGKDDDRNLWPEYLRIIQELKPRWVVGENVPGIITTMLDDVLADLEWAGYTVGTFNIPAAAFGANHRRYRIFVVAHAISLRRGGGRYENAQGQIRALQTERSGSAEEQGILADAESWQNHKRKSRYMDKAKERREGINSASCNGSENVADTTGQGLSQPKTGEQLNTVLSTQRSGLEGRKEKNVPNTPVARLERSDAKGTARTGRRLMQQLGCDWWSVEPDVGRVANGVPNRVDRLKCLGNAVVPQVAEYVGRCIMDAESLDTQGKRE
jgi:DNA (cytosine-5)-methyltransferase 1